MISRQLLPLLTAFALGLAPAAGAPATAQPVRGAQPAPAAPEPTYADLAALSDAAPLAVRARVRSQAPVPAARAPGLAPGHARLYVEAQTLALLAGTSALPEQLRYLVDVPLDAKGRAPRLKKQEFVLFARAVAGRAGELQLIAPDAQLAYTPALEARLRPILAGLMAAGAPPRVTGVREALSGAGNLAGESETQIFLQTADGAPAALTVIRRPGMAPRWGVSWTELVDQSARPPRPETIEWFRLACALPPALPASANIAGDPEDRARAAQDYRFVIEQLGPCARTGARKPG